MYCCFQAFPVLFVKPATVNYVVDWTVIFVRKWDGEAWTGLIWLTIGTGGGILWNGNEPWGAKIAGKFLTSWEPVSF
jgi:hypothetical protein